MKKIITMLAMLIVIFSFCLYIPTSAAVDSAVQTEEELRHKTLEELGILDVKVSNYDASVKRSNFVQYLVKMSGNLTNATTNNSIPYKDVKESDAFYEDVVKAYNLGCLESGENFRPNEQITMDEACSMMIKLLGYDGVSWMKKMAPITAAKRIGFLEGISSSNNGKLTNGGMFKMFYNALFVPVLEADTYTSQSLTFSTGKQYMNMAFDLCYGKGIVEANPISSIYSASGCQNDFVRIEDEIYKTDARFYDMLGHNVEYFYYDRDGLLEMAYMFDSKNGTIFEVSTDELVSLQKNKLTYKNENNKNRTESIEASASFIYNGKLKKFDDIDTTKLSGTITLIDNDGNRSADVVSVVNYTHIVVQGVDKEKFIITGSKTGESFDFEPKSNKRISQIYSDDKEILIGEIAIGDVLSIAQSDTDKGMILIRAILCNKTVEGSVTSKDDEEITIDDTVAEYEEGYIDVEVGDYGTFKYAFNGKIVYAKLENYAVYGYVSAMDVDNFGKGKIKIYTDNDRWVILDVAKRITYNGERKTAAEVCAAAELNEGSSFKPQLVSYRVNKDNQLSKLDTATDFSALRYTDVEKAAIEDGVFRLSSQKTESKFRNALNSFDLETIINGNTYIFVIPDALNLDEMYLGSYNSFVVDQEYYNISFYDIGEDNICRAMVINDDVGRLNFNSVIYPVVGKGGAMDSNGDACSALKVVVDGKEVMMCVEPEVDITGIQKGDIIRGLINHYGNFASLIVEYRHNDPSYVNKKDSTSGLYESNLLAAEIIFVDNKTQYVIVKNGEDRAVMRTHAVKNLYRYNKDENTIVKTDYSVLSPGQQVFIRGRYGIITEMVIFD